MDKPQIYELIQKIMNDISAIAKTQKNAQQGFSFRGVDMVYNEMHKHLATHGVFTVPRQLSRVETSYESKSGTAMLRVVLETEFDFYAPDGSKFTAGPIFTEANDSSDKSTNKAASVAHRTAFLQVFCIPTAEDKDMDAASPENPPAASRPIPNMAPKSPDSQPPSSKITVPQSKRLFAIQSDIFKKTGFWSEHEVRAYMKSKYGKETSTDLSRTEYDALIETIQNKTPRDV